MKRSTRAAPALSAKDALVRAGVRLFSRYGLRRTTMEALAAEAGVAKATAYAYFPNKDAVFAAVCAEVALDLERAAEAAARAAPDPERAVRDSLVAKFARLFVALQSSPHARELLEASQVEAEVEAARARYLKRMQKRLRACRGVEGAGAARQVAETLEAAAEGIVARARDARDLTAKLTLLCTRVLGR